MALPWSLFSHFRTDSSRAVSSSKLQFFFVTCTRGAESLSVLVYVLPKRAPESLSGFSLKHAALVLTNGSSWFFGKILLTLSSPHLTVEWVIHFARL